MTRSREDGDVANAETRCRFWLLMFRPETYEHVKGHGTIGVLKRDKARFAQVCPGDRVVAYVSRLRELDAYGVVTTAPFVGHDPIFGPKSERYTERAQVEFTRTGLRRNATKLLYGVTALENTSTTPVNKLLCSGGFIEITSEDYEWLVGCMEGRIKPQWEDAEEATKSS